MTIFQQLKERLDRHPVTGVSWDEVEARLRTCPDAVNTLCWMEETGGEPRVFGKNGDRLLFVDGAAESPKGRRSLCYDGAARAGRKKNPPDGSAKEQAAAHGLRLLTEAEYRLLQTHGDFDLKTSSWIETPDRIRALGGALFAERRYGEVFVFHNGADSYYGVRGWRGLMEV